MALTDLIPRDLGHPFDPNDPGEDTVFRQHGCEVPSCTDMADRIGLNPGVPASEEVDRIYNKIIPELAAIAPEDPPGSGRLRLPTPEIFAPTREFQRQMAHGIILPTPGNPSPNTGNEFVEVWSFDSDTQTDVWPAPTIRAREGDLAHTHLTTRRGTHTIHQHAIEPTTMNDGVGHISFEVDGAGYTYQWLASESGTYLYHCHKNTVLHFEMGMYGFLIVDPDVTGAPFVDGGPGQVRRANNIISYDIERLWAVDEIDRRWHDIVGNDVNAGVECPFFHADINGVPNGELNGPNDPHLHRFEPDVFVISGIAASPGGPNLLIDAANDPAERVRVVANKGETVLLRLLCAGYTTQVYRIGLPSELIEVDARTLGFGDRQQYSQPVVIPANEPFELTTARRKTLLIDTNNVAPGVYPVTVEFWDWIAHRQQLWATIETSITVI